MGATFMTGATGYLGAYAATELLNRSDDDLLLLVRAPDRAASVAKLWHSWQLVVDGEAFAALLPRVTFVSGDLHADGLGLSEADTAMLRERTTSVLHVAASLNRKSDKVCLNTNVRGALSVILLTQTMPHAARFTFVSTVAVCGHRQGEDLAEDDVVDWSRSDYDPYARTKKLGEHLVRSLLPDREVIVVRPSIAMGDPDQPATTQFDMIFATSMLYDMRVLPLDPDSRVDIVPGSWTGRAIARLHATPSLPYDTFHLSSGAASPTVRDLCDALDAHLGRTGMLHRSRFAPRVEGAWDLTYRAMNRAPRGTMVRGVGSLWKVFWPYVTFDTVFLNDRVVEVLGDVPTPFIDFAGPFYDWVKEHRFQYPHVPLPAGIA